MRLLQICSAKSIEDIMEIICQELSMILNLAFFLDK